jgi:hypothetical protein
MIARKKQGRKFKERNSKIKTFGQDNFAVLVS